MKALLVIAGGSIFLSVVLSLLLPSTFHNFVGAFPQVTWLNANIYSLYANLVPLAFSLQSIFGSAKILRRETASVGLLVASIVCLIVSLGFILLSGESGDAGRYGILVQFLVYSSAVATGVLFEQLGQKQDSYHSVDLDVRVAISDLQRVLLDFQQRLGSEDLQSLELARLVTRLGNKNLGVDQIAAIRQEAMRVCESVDRLADEMWRLEPGKLEVHKMEP